LEFVIDISHNIAVPTWKVGRYRSYYLPKHIGWSSFDGKEKLSENRSISKLSCKGLYEQS
jgi:hypothetical protein